MGLIISSLLLLLIDDAQIYLKKKYILLLVIIGIVLPTILSENVYFRQIGLFKRIGQYYHGTAVEKFGHIRHFVHYDTAWQIFRDYPGFGIGNSKFRFTNASSCTSVLSF